jgi:predicted nucleotidyltransferase
LRVESKKEQSQRSRRISSMKDSLKKAIRIIVEVAEPDKIILFGSHARGDDRPDSDYDILVLKKGAKRQRALTQKIYMEFKDIGAPIDVIVADLDRFEELKTDPYLIYAEAARNGRTVYEKAPAAK